MSESRFVAVVPVKPPSVGKSRLAGVPDEHRRELAAAFAQDTIAAARESRLVEEVLVVTDDHRFAASMVGQGCRVVPDGVSGDLNATLVLAAAEGRRRWPSLRPLALCADLPALRAADLDELLARVPSGPAFLPDVAGTGTTLYSAPHATFGPRFGPGSSAAHRAGGAIELESSAAGLRQDVDDLDDLRRALTAGVGPHTARVLGRHLLPPGVSRDED